MAYFRLKLRNRLGRLSSLDEQQDFLFDSLRLFRFDPNNYFVYWLLFFACGLWFFFNGYFIFSAVLSLLTSFHAVSMFFIFFIMYRRFFVKWLL